MISSKRIFDIVLTIPGTLAILPVIIITTLLVWLKIGTPVLFSQKRPGLYGKVFKI